MGAAAPAPLGAQGAAAPGMQILTRAGPGALPSPAPAGSPAVAMATAIYIYIFFPLITGTSRATVFAGGCFHPAEGCLERSPPRTHSHFPTQSKSSASALSQSPQCRGSLPCPVPWAAACIQNPPSLRLLSCERRGRRRADPEPQWGQLVVGAAGTPPWCCCSCLAMGSHSPLPLYQLLGETPSGGEKTNPWLLRRYLSDLCHE